MAPATLNIRDIDRDAMRFVNERLADAGEVSMEKSVRLFREKFGAIYGPGAAVAETCFYEVLYKTLKRAISKFETASTNDSAKEAEGELLFPGFEKMRRAYTVDRDGDLILVATDQLTNEELLDRARQFRSNAKALVEHAKEIEFYVRNRDAITPKG